jgi:hypothetical protein
LIWHPEVLLPMVGLAVLALLPVIGPPLLRASRRLGKKGGGRND